MLHIAVIEDNDTDYESLCTALERFFAKDPQKGPWETTRYTDSESFLENYASQFQLIFMDIDLPSKNGMVAAKELREKDENVAIVFITNLSHFAINGYEVNALDYILKPVNPFQFSLKMPKILHHIQINGDKQITIRSKTAIQRMLVSDIYYVEVIAHDLIYHTKSGNFETRGTMKEAEQMLDAYQFCRCNNCYLVNLRYVQGINANKVSIAGDDLIISRNKKTEFVNRLTDYIGGQI